MHRFKTNTLRIIALLCSFCVSPILLLAFPLSAAKNDIVSHTHWTCAAASNLDFNKTVSIIQGGYIAPFVAIVPLKAATITLGYLAYREIKKRCV